MSQITHSTPIMKPDGGGLQSPYDFYFGLLIILAPIIYANWDSISNAVKKKIKKAIQSFKGQSGSGIVDWIKKKGKEIMDLKDDLTDSALQKAAEGVKNKLLSEFLKGFKGDKAGAKKWLDAELRKKRITVKPDVNPFGQGGSGKVKLLDDKGKKIIRDGVDAGKTDAQIKEDLKTAKTSQVKSECGSWNLSCQKKSADDMKGEQADAIKYADEYRAQQGKGVVNATNPNDANRSPHPLAARFNPTEEQKEEAKKHGGKPDKSIFGGCDCEKGTKRVKITKQKGQGLKEWTTLAVDSIKDAANTAGKVVVEIKQEVLKEAINASKEVKDELLKFAKEQGKEIAIDVGKQVIKLAGQALKDFIIAQLTGGSAEGAMKNVEAEFEEAVDVHHSKEHKGKGPQAVGRAGNPRMTRIPMPQIPMRKVFNYEDFQRAQEGGLYYGHLSPYRRKRIMGWI